MIFIGRPILLNNGCKCDNKFFTKRRSIIRDKISQKAQLD